MKVTRKTEIDTNSVKIGDQIHVGKYTATCQAIPGTGLALFLLDQYLDNAMKWNRRDTTEGGYAKSYVRQVLNSPEILKTFEGLDMVPHENGDLLRLPFYGEMFGHDEWYYAAGYEEDDAEQWPLMKDRRNRIADREGEEYEWGWLQNVRSAAAAALVDNNGRAYGPGASLSNGVRPAFIIKLS